MFKKVVGDFELKDTKYIIYFKEKFRKTNNPIRLLPNGEIKTLQSVRYTLYDKLMHHINMDEAF